MTNPLDLMEWLLWHTTNFPKHRVIVMVVILVAPRLRASLPMHLVVTVTAVPAMCPV